MEEFKRGAVAVGYIEEKLPWYNTYTLIMDDRAAAINELETVGNPESQFQKIKKFYDNIGADCSKNYWIKEYNKGLGLDDTEKLDKLQKIIKFGYVVDTAIRNQDNDSIGELYAYRDNEQYKEFIKQLMFYLGVAKAQTDIQYIDKAYTAISRTYPINNLMLFKKEGAYYYEFYLLSLKICLSAYENEPDYKTEVYTKVDNYCKKISNDLEPYISNGIIWNEVQMLQDRIASVYGVMREKG